ncbi:V-type proton ATPase subunit C 1-B-like [Stegodyphus dumicola]|uniref:V-type proton ATPase subunit C 1-B-like n=1 Tax=Stegodyphus dumicola TaxID=202533 RepID=UPI0015B2631A|nr:V-type proton ATPase subunit C 1-B-like [Stegodyphus dumicola]
MSASVKAKQKINIEVNNKNLVKSEELPGTSQSFDSDSFDEQKDPFEKVLNLKEKRRSALKPCDSCEFKDILDDVPTWCCGLCRPRSESVEEFWLISVPRKKKSQQIFDQLNVVTENKHLSVNYKFHIPNFLIGTLDKLIGLLGDLKELDSYTEDLVQRIFNLMRNIVDDTDKLKDNLMVNDIDLPTYVIRFTWNKAKYPEQQSLKHIYYMLKKEMGNLENDMEQRSGAYFTSQSKVSILEERESGNLIRRPLADIVKKEHFVLGSKYLTTLLVVVPSNLEKAWHATYATLAEMVVPDSSIKVYDDKNHYLYTVTLYKRCVEEFKTNAKQRRFFVRDFEYSEQDLAADKMRSKKLKADKYRKLVLYWTWLKLSFAECFSALIHIKALRIFADSVVRYGLSVNFHAILIQPIRCVKLRKALDELYKDINIHLAAGTIPEIPRSLQKFNVQEYCRYVFLKINLNFIDG